MMISTAAAASTRSMTSCAASSMAGCSGVVETRLSQPISRSLTSVFGREIAMKRNARTQDGGGPQINDRQAGVANISWHGLSDEPEDGQQDDWESNPGQKANRFAHGELGLDLEQFGEASAPTCDSSTLRLRRV